MTRTCFHSAGFTLLELLLVMALLAIVSLVAVPRAAASLERARRTVAEADLHALRGAFVGTDASPGLLADLGGIPGFSPTLLRVGNLLSPTNLFACVPGAPAAEAVRLDDHAPRVGFAPAESFRSWDEARGRGWHGPYLAVGCDAFPARAARHGRRAPTAEGRGLYPDLSRLTVPPPLRVPGAYAGTYGDFSIYGVAGEATVLDPWGTPYVLQVPPPEAFSDDGAVEVTDAVRFSYARVVSAGPDGRLETPCFFERDGDARDMRLAGRRVDGAAVRGDDLVLFLFRADIYEEAIP